MKILIPLILLMVLTNNLHGQKTSNSFLTVHENLENGFRGFVLPASWESDDSFYTQENKDTLLLSARYLVYKRRFDDFYFLVQKADRLIEDDVIQRNVSIERVNAENEQYHHEVADSLIFELKKSKVVADEYYEIWLDILFTAVLNRTKMYEEAVNIYNRTENRIDSLSLGHVYTYTHINIANSYYRLGKGDFANKLYRKSLRKSLKFSNTRMAGIGSNNMAITFLRGRFDNEKNLDSAKYYNELAFNFFESINDSAKIAGCLMTKGFISNELGQTNEAKKAMEEAAHLFEIFPNRKKQAQIYAFIGSSNWNSSNPQEVIYPYLRALELTEIEQLYSLDYQIADNLSFYYKGLEMPDSALHYAERAASSNSKKSRKDQTKSLMAFYALYETETYKNESLEKSLEIAQNELKIQSQQTKQNYLLGGGLFALLIGGYALRSQRKKRKASELALIEREAAAEREVEELMQKHRYATLAASIDAEEKERDRLSKELHDGVGSTLSGIAMQLEAIRNDEQVEALSPLLERLRSSYDELRALSRNIGMPAVKENTLVELTGTLLSNVQADSSLKISYIVFPKNEAFNIDERIEIAVYRVIQEAMNNVMKHAQANQVEVQLTKSDEELDVMIEDDGRGFDSHQQMRGIGLKNMKDRVQSLGGQLLIDSRRGKGTILSFSIPLKE